MTTRPWNETAYRRVVHDIHVPDWDERFLAKFDPREFVDEMVAMRAQELVFFAHSHVGLFLYPTRVGRAHRGLRGRNVVREVVERCRARKLAIVLYASVIYDNYAAEAHPDWRIRHADGSVYGAHERYGTVCPNSPYRDYVQAWTEELCREFDFDGVRFDMTYWPTVCYCAHCRARYRRETAAEMPTVVNWLDETWVDFQHRREAWLAEFAALATGIVRRMKPGATVEHQASTLPLNWTYGVNASLVPQNDFLQGDFYGDAVQGSFVRKLLEDLTPRRPMAFETSFSLSLRDHTGRKSEALLTAKAASAIADAAAFVFIGAVDPEGTLNELAQRRMGAVFEKLAPFWEHVGGERVVDVALYYSLDSKFDYAGNGRPVMQADTHDVHTASVMDAVRALSARHVPYGVITKHSLAKLARCRVLVLANVNAMDDEEVAAIRAWVRGGGTVYASGSTSLVDKRGRLQRDFMLADVFGVSFVEANWQPAVRHVAPTAGGQTVFRDWTAQHPPQVKAARVRVRAHACARVLATTTLPWPPEDLRRFTSIHSNPPWTATEEPELVEHAFGRGRAIYASAPLESIEALTETFIALVTSGGVGFHFEVDAPAAVEATMFHQPERRRFVFTIVNFQAELPNIPVDGIVVRLRLGGAKARSIEMLPSGAGIPHAMHAEVVSFTAPRLETLAMFAVNLA